MTTRALKKRLRSKDAECIFHELLIADVAIPPEMEEMARAAARSAVVEYEDAGVRERTGPDWRSSRVLRRAVVVACLFALLFVPIMETGSSLAMRFMSMIAELTEDRLVFHPRESPGIPVVEDDREIMKEYDDYATLTAETGLRPLQLHDPTFELDYLEYCYWLPTGKDVTSLYCSKEDGSVVLIRQEWENTTEQNVFLENQEIRTETWGGIEYYVLEDQIDGVVTLYTALEDSILTIGIENAEYVERVMKGLAWPDSVTEMSAEIQKEYDDYATLTAETGLRPLQFQDPEYELVFIKYNYWVPTGKDVTGQYRSKKDGSFITLRQVWEGTAAYHINTNNTTITIETWNGVEFYVLENRIDKTVAIYAILEDSVFIAGVPSVDYVERVMKGLVWPDSVAEINEPITKKYDDYASLTAETRFSPIQMSDPAFRLDELSYRYSPQSGSTVTGIYISQEDGSSVLLRQKWDPRTSYHIFLENQEIRTETWGGIEYYVLEDQIDGVVSLYTALEDSFLTIGIENAEYVERVMKGLVWPTEAAQVGVEIEREYADFASLAAETGIVPLQLDASPFQLCRIEYDRFYDDETVVSIYTSKEDGSFVTIRQEWGVTSKLHITLQNQEVELRRKDGIDWYILQDQIDNTITLYADMNEYFLMIGVQNEDYVEQVMEGLTLDMSMQ